VDAGPTIRPPLIPWPMPLVTLLAFKALKRLSEVQHNCRSGQRRVLSSLLEYFNVSSVNAIDIPCGESPTMMQNPALLFQAFIISFLDYTENQSISSSSGIVPFLPG
jgi:hypothetical protein